LQYLFYDSVSDLPIGKIQYQADDVVNTAKCIHLYFTSNKTWIQISFCSMCK